MITLRLLFFFVLLSLQMSTIIFPYSDFLSQQSPLPSIQPPKIQKFIQDIKNDNKQEVQHWIEIGNYVDKKLIHGATPLMLATLHQSTEVMLTLLAAGASVDATNNEGFTPLCGQPKTTAQRP